MNDKTGTFCDFCNKTFSSISSLNYHKETAKYCLKIQGKDIKDILEQYKCKNCNSLFTNKHNLNHHVELCNKKYESKEQEITNYKDMYTSLFKELNEFKLLLLEKDLEIKEVYKIVSEKDLEIKEVYKIVSEKDRKINELTNTITEIAKQPKIENNNTTMTHKNTNNTTNIKGNQTIQNILADRKVYEKNTNREHIISIAKDNDMEKYFWKGQKGVAQFFVDHIVKTDDGKMIICCTDKSRHHFRHINEKNQIGEDIEARNFTEKVSGPIKEVVEEVYNNIQKDIEDKMVNRDDNYDSGFLSTKKSLALEKYIQIKNIDDNNNNNEYIKDDNKNDGRRADAYNSGRASLPAGWQGVGRSPAVDPFPGAGERRRRSARGPADPRL